MVAKQAEQGLPAEYQQVEWIGIDNTTNVSRYIMLRGDVLSKADLSNYTLLVTMSDINDDTGNPNTTGVVFGTSGNAGCYFASKNNLLVMAASATGQYSSIPKREYKMQWDSSGGTVYSNNDIIASRNFANMTGDQSFFLGSSVSNNNAKSFRCYDAKILIGNTVISHYIPCYRKSDGKIGVYDVVTNVFRFNSFNAKGDPV